VDIWLDRSEVELPRRRIITSGCGGGVTFNDLSQRQAPLNTHTTIAPQQIFERMRELYQAGNLYQATQGIHTSALGNAERLLLVAEDVGRHNTIDRLWGQAMKQGMQTRGLILFATGRISSEMLEKSARMSAVVVVSRTSPTSQSVALANELGITLVGYARKNGFQVYTHPERLVGGAQIEE
jgi:FdhD protein